MCTPRAAQGAFNVLLSDHARCLGHAFNCYDPFTLLSQADAATAAADRAILSECGALPPSLLPSPPQQLQLQQPPPPQLQQPPPPPPQLQQQQQLSSSSRTRRQAARSPACRINQTTLRQWKLGRTARRPPPPGKAHDMAFARPDDASGSLAAQSLTAPMDPRCQSFTCARLRDLDGVRSRCLDTGLRHGGLGTSLATGRAVDPHILNATMAPSPSPSSSSPSPLLLAALGQRRPSWRPMPHIIHFMADHKPWNPSRAHDRYRQPFHYLWHAVDAAAVAEVLADAAAHEAAASAAASAAGAGASQDAEQGGLLGARAGPSAAAVAMHEHRASRYRTFDAWTRAALPVEGAA